MEAPKKPKNENDDFELKLHSFLPSNEYRHVYNDKVICVTDGKGYVNPDNASPLKLRIDATNGFIPLWETDVTLNWRFSKSFGNYFNKPEAAKAGIRRLLGEAILAWREACPIKFHEDNDAWDFEIEMHQEDCDPSGCVLASTFFPNSGQNTFYIYPTLFTQSYKKQVEIMEHEIGHIFGLRHFFANLSELDEPSILFGVDDAFSIMNYGDKSILTANDINDLKSLYKLVWSGQLAEINGTQIRLFKPYHMSGRKTVRNTELADDTRLTGFRENIDTKVKRLILNVKGNYTTNPDDLFNELELKSNLLYNSTDFIFLARKLNQLIVVNDKKINNSEMNKCKTVGDCVTLVKSKI
jgi:hypothetical protein